MRDKSRSGKAGGNGGESLYRNDADDAGRKMEISAFDGLGKKNVERHDLEVVVV